MSLRNRLVLPVILSSLAVLAACGGSSSNPTVTPPPSGAFSNSNLNGMYVFSATGTDTAGNFVTMMGAFNADGKGNIASGGMIDVNGTAGLAQAAINSGSYSVGSDGRPIGTSALPGLMTLETSASTYTFDYVLASNEHGLITEFDGNGSASGTLDLETTVSQSSLNGQSFAFNFTGTSGLATSLCGLSMPTGSVAPLATVGAFTLDSSGNISAGQADFNNNCVWSGPPTLTVTGGSVAIGSPGTASIATTASGTATTYKFDVFPIDATHLKFIEVDNSTNILVGDAFTQASSISSGNNVFTVAGFDSNANVGGPFTAAGILNTDGNGTITNSVEDINDAFSVPAPVTNITGNYSAVSGGRATIALGGFVNGNNGTACSACMFAAYPSSGGLQLLEIDGQGTTNGVAYAQSATTLASGEGYGMNLSGLFLNNSAATTNEEDDIAEFTNTNGTLGGIIDFNDQGALNFKQTFQAGYAADTAVPGRGTVSATTNAYALNTYVVDSSTAVAVSVDPSYVALGALMKQNSSAKSNAAATHLAVLKAAKPATQMANRSMGRVH